MAIPPEPLSEVLRAAELVVEAEVEAVLEAREDAPPVDAPKNWVDVGRMDGSQLLRLRVLRTLRGDPPGPSLVVEKPIAPYTLDPGTAGPFPLARRDETWFVVGRYGPLFRQMSDVEATLAALDPD